MNYVYLSSILLLLFVFVIVIDEFVLEVEDWVFVECLIEIINCFLIGVFIFVGFMIVYSGCIVGEVVWMDVVCIIIEICCSKVVRICRLWKVCLGCV